MGMSQLSFPRRAHPCLLRPLASTLSTVLVEEDEKDATASSSNTPDRPDRAKSLHFSTIRYLHNTLTISMLRNLVYIFAQSGKGGGGLELSAGIANPRQSRAE